MTDLVKSFGTVSWTMDNVKFNKFEQGAVSIMGRNDKRQWSDESGNPDALFAGYLTPYKTLFRINCGYYDTNGSILPTATAVFYGIVVDEIAVNSENEAVINVNPMSWVVSEVSAAKIDTSGITITAENLVAAVRDVRDATGTGSFLLRPFITSTDWDIQTTTTQYIDFVNTGLDNYNCWSLLEKLAETEGYVVYFGTDGRLHFTDRVAPTATTWIFNGPGKYDSDYGTNIVEVESIRDGWTGIYQRIRIKHLSEDTSTSYYTSEQGYLVGDGSSSWKYGVRSYEFENLWLNTASAQTMADNIRGLNTEPKKEYEISTKLITTLDLLDRVAINYIGLPTVDPPALWDQAFWDLDYWTGDQGAIFANSVTCKIIRIEHDLDNFVSNFTLKEI